MNSSSAPRPRPGPPAGSPAVPKPGAESPRGAGSPSPATSASDARTPQQNPAEWGRVDEDGTVYVRTEDGERPVGQWVDADPAEGLAFFARKYDALAFEIELLEQRIASGNVSPGDATAAVAQLNGTVAEANVVGDLAALRTRLADLEVLIAKQRERRQAERAHRLAEAQTAKERIAEQAEQLAESKDWKAGADRLRTLLDEWKDLPRLDKPVDDALWRRFSNARTTYTRRRKAHFAELGEKREQARGVKEKLVTEAEALADSREWGPTTVAYRELMRRWKAAGPAPKNVDEKLWQRFRAAQDRFFGARDEANAALDAEFAKNAEQKEALLAQAEALLPITDARAARSQFRQIAERWDAAGKVPRERVKELEGRLRAVDQAIRQVEEDTWRRSNPEARARAADTVAQLEASLTELEAQRAKAEAAGKSDAAAAHAAAIASRQAWLAEARKALEEFGG